MISLGTALLQKLIIHKVGNRLLEENVVLSDELADLAQPGLPDVLNAYFLSAFKDPVFYQFHHVSSLDLHEVYTIASALFNWRKEFIKHSRAIEGTTAWE